MRPRWSVVAATAALRRHSTWKESSGLDAGDRALGEGCHKGPTLGRSRSHATRTGGGGQSRAGWLCKARLGGGRKGGKSLQVRDTLHLEAGSHVTCAALAYQRHVSTREEEFPKSESNSHVNIHMKRCVFCIISH